MANVVIKGVYTSKTALDTAELATASAGDTYIVGSKIPYDLYTYDSTSTSFKKGNKVSDKVSELSTPVSIDDVTEDIPLSSLFTTTFHNGSQSLKVRQAIGRVRQDVYELYGA